MSRFVLTVRAGQDLDDIWEYIAADNIEAADRVLDRMEKAFYQLANNPASGHYREELADKSYRFRLVYSYLIVYRWETRPLQILRILNAARDVQAILNLAAPEEE